MPMKRYSNASIMTDLISLPGNKKSRRRQRFVPLQHMVLISSVVSTIVTITLFPKASVSWTFAIAKRKTPTTESWSLSVDSYRHRKRSFRLHSTTEDELDSAEATFSSSAIPSSVPMPLSSPAKEPHLSSPTTPAVDEIAIVLNTNAKGVTYDLIETAKGVVLQSDIERQNSSHHIPRVRLLVTSTFEEARNASRNIMATANTAGSMTLVIPVGGDGTLTAMINLLWEEYRSFSIDELTEDSTATNGSEEDANNGSTNTDSHPSNKFPIVFGYVAMGTGNALGSVVGCMPVTSNQNKRGKKRRMMLRLLRKCIRPQITKRDDFRLVLSQLIKSVTQTKPGTTEKQDDLALQSKKIKVDVLDLPLIRVRTNRGEVAAQTTNGHSSPNGDEEANKDRYAFFAGLGYDSLLLQDYKDQQDWTATKTKNGDRGIWNIATTGVVGYTVAMFTRSLPKLLKLEDASRLLRDVKITTNDPESTFWIDHRRGDITRPVHADAHPIGNAKDESTSERQEEEKLLYRGSAGIIASATVPYYGGGLRLFPFARMTPGGMHLRIGRAIHPLEGVSRIPSIFEGSFRDKSSGTFQCLDFVGNQFAVEIYESSKYDDKAATTRHEIEEGFPVQHSGESIGRCTRVDFTVSSSSEVTREKQDTNGTNSMNGSEGNNEDPIPPPIRFLTLLPPRIVEEQNVMNLHP